MIFPCVVFVVILFFRLFLFVFLFPVISLASPTEPCELNELQDKLLDLGLDPDIRNNGQLLFAFENKYGKSVTNHFIEENIFVEVMPDAAIDIETLSWAAKAVWDADNPASRYFPILADISKEKALDEYVFALYFAIGRSKKITPVFESDREKNIFINFWRVSLKRVLLKDTPTASETDLKDSLDKFAEHYLAPSRLRIGLSEIIHTEPVVVLFGHSAAQKEVILIGDEYISIEQIVVKLKKLDLPRDAILKVNACFSGCVNSTLPYEISEIKELFKSGLLITNSGTIKGSLLDKLSIHLFQEIPSFSGEVQGYLGALFSGPKKNVLRKDGKILAKANAVEVTSTSGNSILLKKEQLRVSIKR